VTSATRAEQIGRVFYLVGSALAIDEEAYRKAWHQWSHVYASLRLRLGDLFGSDLSRLRLLDFGSGYCAPMVLLLSGEVQEIIGLDVCPVLRDGLLERLRWSPPGHRPSLPAAVLKYMIGRRMVHHLRRLSGLRADLAALRLVRYAGGPLPFPDSAFDCVISNAVLQELPAESLALYAGELARVLRPGGYVDLSWHNFYAWSGNYLSPEENLRRPWGHLLGGRCHPALNRCTPDEITAVFAPHFASLRLLGHDLRHHICGRDPEFRPEGEELLTPELAAQLAAYPREWLTTRGFILQGRRPVSGME
jgi:SAM-dependent methyltransferase